MEPMEQSSGQSARTIPGAARPLDTHHPDSRRAGSRALRTEPVVRVSGRRHTGNDIPFKRFAPVAVH